MKVERITLTDSSDWKKSVDTISILVVDDDTTCLAIVAAILKKFKYEVATVKHPNDALCTLRIKGGAFDLVVSDVHMPDMNGFELQQAIAQEFNLPVVLMSADNKEGVALKGLESGAAFFIVKPVCPDDLRDLWQFASMKKKSQVVIEDTEKNASDEIAVSESSVNEDTSNKKDSKRKSPGKEGSDDKKEENSQSASKKKHKVIWTNSLHNRFLEAIRSIGLDRAVPKKILEVMNVPGLTRENVASHLQKYRIFLRRVSDASYKIQYCSDKGLSSSRNFITSISGLESSSSSVPIPSPPLILNKFSTSQNIGQFSGHTFPASSTSNLITRSGSGQSRLLSNRGSLLKPNTGTPNLMIYQNDDRHHFPNNYPRTTSGTSIQGHLASISLEDISTTRSINPPDDMGITWDIRPSSKENFTNHQSNYVGYSISNIKHLTESGHSEKYKGFSSCKGAMSTVVPSDNDFNLDRLPNQHSFVVDNNTFGGGSEEQLSDVIADCGMLLPSDPPLVSGAQIHESAFTPIFCLSDEFDILPTPQPVEEGGFEATNSADHQVINTIQNRTQCFISQRNGCESSTTNSNFYSDTSHWDNSIPSFDQPPNQHQRSEGFMNSQGFGTSSQLNETELLPSIQQQVGEGLSNSLEFAGTSWSRLSRTLLSPAEHDDDDFLESLLAPFGEEQTPKGI